MPVVPFRIPGLFGVEGFSPGVNRITSDRGVGVTTFLQDFTRLMDLAEQDFLVVTKARVYGGRGRHTISDPAQLRSRMRGRNVRALIFDAPGGEDITEDFLGEIPLQGVPVILGSTSFKGTPTKNYDFKFIGDDRVLYLSPTLAFALRLHPQGGLHAYPFHPGFGTIILTRFDIDLDI